MSPSPETTAQPPTAQARSRAAWIGLVGVLLVTLGVFWRTVEGDFVYDDRLMIERNPRVAEARWGELLTRPYWDFLRPEDSSQIGYWRPLTATVLTVSYALGDGAPRTFHIAALLVHLAAVAAAFAFVRRLTRSAWIATGSALLFGLHPIHVESVAWISALNDPLFGLFALLTLERFLAWRDRGSSGVPLAAATCFALGLFAKELAAAVLPLLIALDYARLKRDESEGSFLHPNRAYIPFAVVFAGYIALRMAVFGSFWAGFERTTTDFAVSSTRLLYLRAEILGGAAELLAWPWSLQLFRPFRPHIGLDDPALLRAILATIALAAAIGFAGWRRSRGLLFALLIIPAGLLPALIRVESLGRFPLSDRFLYLPALGIGMLVAFAAIRLPRWFGGALIFIVAGLYAAKSHAQAEVWRNEESLFRHAATSAPRSVYAKWGLGRVLLDKYRIDGEVDTLREANDTFEEAKDLLIEAKFATETDLFVTSRDYLQVNLGSGWCHLYRGEIDETEIGIATGIWEELARVIEEVQAEESEARELGIRVRSANLELELVYTALGAGYMQAERFDEAIEVLRKALELNPNNPEALQNLGRTYARLGDWELALDFFEQALALRPGSLEDRLLIAQASFESGAFDRAEALARELADRGSDQAEPYILLATLHMRREDAEGAQRWIDRSLELEPKNGHAWYLRGNNYLMRQMIPEGLAALRRSAELQPDSFEAFYQYGALLLQAGGGTEETLPVLMRAYALADRDDALAALHTTLLELASEHISPLLDMAHIDRGRGRQKEAQAAVDAALAIDPNHGDALFLKGRVLADFGQSEAALPFLRRAAKVHAESFNVQHELGIVLQRAGRKAEALSAFERARELGPPATWEEGARRVAMETLDSRIESLR